MAESSENVKNIVVNRKVRAFFEVVERYEAGLSLLGSEVKSIRAGRISLKEAYCRLDRGELFLVNCHIAHYIEANIQNHDPLRRRRLLLHRRELNRIAGRINEKGCTALPLRIYLKGSLIKLELALVRGRKKADRREEIKRRDMKRDLERELKEMKRR